VLFLEDDFQWCQHGFSVSFLLMFVVWMLLSAFTTTTTTTTLHSTLFGR